MNVASLELCKELYELSGWIETTTTGITYTAIDPPPRYTLGFLLRKLPDAGFLYEAWKDSKGWHLKLVSRRSLAVTAVTPEDAAAQLAIELFKQGVLSHDNQ